MIAEMFISNSPGNSPSTSKLIMEYKDSTYWKNFYPENYFPLMAGANNGQPVTFLWLDATGRFRGSSYSSVLGAYMRYIDTASLSNRVNLKLTSSDTASRWAPKGVYISPLDTGGMLNPYLRKSDTIYMSDRIINKVNVADTGAMLAPYLKRADTIYLSNRVLTKLSISDTAIMLQPYMRKSDTISLSARINQKVNISDTANKWAPRGVYIRPADTSAMLGAYLRKGDTSSLSNRINLKLNKTDTTGKWLPVGTFIPTSQAQSDWTQTNTGSSSFILNKPNVIGTVITRSLNSSFQPSTTRNILAIYSVEISASLTLTSGQDGTVFLETSPDNSTWTTQAQSRGSNTGALTIGINTTQVTGSVLICFVPAGYYVRLRTVNNTGTPVFTYVRGKEHVF